MKARPLLRSLPVAGLVIVMAGFILGPATPAGAFASTPGFPDLNVTKAGSGTGTVTSSDGHITCGADCDEFYPALGSPLLTLTATPAAGSQFAGWDVAGGATSAVTSVLPSLGKIDVTLPAGDLGDTLVTATFSLIGSPCPFPFCFPHGPGALTVAKAGAGTGTVTSTDGLINCGTDCGQTYGGLTQVTLIATPGPNSSFAGWNVAGDATNLVGCGGLGSCTLLVNNSGFFGLHTIVTAGFNAVSPVAAATVDRVIHFHQHGGIGTGPWHHGVRHQNGKHTHRHVHKAL